MKYLALLALLPTLAFGEGLVVNPEVNPRIEVGCSGPTTTVNGEAVAIALYTFYVSTDKLNWTQAGTNTSCLQQYTLTDTVNGQYYYTSDATDNNGSTSIKGVDGVPSEFVAVQVQRPLPPATSIDLQGTPPESGVITAFASIPATTTKVTLILDVFDPDFADEGSVSINGNTPIILFGADGVSTNDNINVIVRLDTTVSDWIDGDNELLFSHTSTGGYRIDSVTVESVSTVEQPLAAPTNVRATQK